MKNIIIFSFFFISVITVMGQKAKILFLGNSYTAVNDLPGTLYNLALSGGDTIIYNSNTPGGYTFQMHSTDAITLAKINNDQWDYVVLQEQSQLPSFSPAEVQTNVYPYAAILDSLIHKNDPCTKTVFYMTWGRKYGDASNCGVYPPVCTFEGMAGRLRQSYLEMGDMFECPVAPVGMAWKRSRGLDSTINLWAGDNSHPSVEGTYLTACVFYSTLFQKPTSGLAYYSSLNSTNAQFLQLVADNIVFDSLATWNIGVFEPQAGFSWNINVSGIQFVNESVNANTYQWFFGDGFSSIEQSPLHTYSIPGNYTVTQIISDSCEYDTLTHVVEVLTTGLCNDVITSELLVYPNPFNSTVNIEFPLERNGTYFIELEKIDGSIVQIDCIQPSNGERIISFNTGDLPSGLYYIRIDSSKGIVLRKVIKIGNRP